MFYYFGYGSNINLTSLKAKGVVPLHSEVATLSGWKLKFNVRHWFRHEGGVASIEKASAKDRVLGVVHLCEDHHLEKLDAVESYGVGYDRVEVDLLASSKPIKALTYVGLPEYLDNNCKPTQRYLNIITKGARESGIDIKYIENLEKHPIVEEIFLPPFVPELKSDFIPEFDTDKLLQFPKYTALCDAVFDMSNARHDLRCLHSLFGGKDMTLFHLRRHDSSQGHETLSDIAEGKIASRGMNYLNTYLWEYNKEFQYIGKFLPNINQ